MAIIAIAMHMMMPTMIIDIITLGLILKKRSRKRAAAFRNEDSCLLMFYAVFLAFKLRRFSLTNQGTEPLQFLHNP